MQLELHQIKYLHHYKNFPYKLHQSLDPKPGLKYCVEKPDYVRNKYAATPREIYALKHFLSVGLFNTYGDDVSVIKVKEKIKELIKNENKKIPLSDQNITNMLKENGYEISRRTVAKYREQLFIPSTRERRVI